MSTEIYIDEFKTLAKRASEYHIQICDMAHAQRKKEPLVRKTNVVFSDGTILEDSLLPALAGSRNCEALFIDAFENADFTAEFTQNKGTAFECAALDDITDKSFENTAFILLIDSKKHNQKWKEILEFCVQKANNSADNKIVIALLLPKLRVIPNGIEKL
ncbi:MAG: hypothetical protein U0K54_00215 [Acutalibacteraceae bacterium]|nr:hypothetical protein [Acutalibacteraceae bacterium]